MLPQTARTLLLPALLGLAASAASAQVPAPPQQRPIALVGGTVHPVSGPAIENGVVLFDEGEITAVGDAGAVRLSDRVRVIDCAGRHVYPGVFAANTRLGLTEIEALRPTADFDEVGNVTPEVRAAVSVNPDSTLIPVARTNGVLTVLTLPSGGLVPGRASVIRTDGWTWEDMTVSGDAGLVVNWPRTFRGPSRFGGRGGGGGNSAERAVDSLTDLVKAARAYRAEPEDRKRADIRLEAMGPYVTEGEGRKPMIVSADAVDQITAAVQWADEQGVRIVILGGRDAPLCAALLKEHGVPVILRGTHGMPDRRDAAYDEAFTTPAALEAAGVAWCLGPSDVDANVRNLAYEAASAVAYGLDADAAVRSITLAPAEILGLGDRLGSLEPGKAATLIVTDGPLLEISTNTTSAFIDGREVDLSNKQTKLRDKYREKYRQLGIIPD
jgi:imidazolonepropionase-like amidohydrolase